MAGGVELEQVDGAGGRLAVEAQPGPGAGGSAENFGLGILSRLQGGAGFAGAGAAAGSPSGGSVWLDEGAELGEADTGIGLERPREGTSTEPNDGALLP